MIMASVMKDLKGISHTVISKNVKNTHEPVSLLVKLRAEAYNFNKINALPCVFFVY